MLKLKLQSFGHLMQRADSLEKTLMLGKTERGRKRGNQRVRWLDGVTGFDAHEFEQVSGVGMPSPWGRKELDVTERLN